MAWIHTDDCAVEQRERLMVAFDAYFADATPDPLDDDTVIEDVLDADVVF